ncbi:MAG: hypothetical protein FWG93_03835, partial [Oscillospiraceae bacterium]|nr:hypothetical protein [Oscillospiraceae bacterium]
MNVKRYIGEDITACMAQVREELGVEAFILNQRTIRRKGLLGWLQKPLVEVVAAYEPKEEKKAPRPAPRYALSDPVFPPPPEALPAREDSPPRPAAASPAPAAISPKEAHAAAMSVLERIAAKNAVDAAPSPPAPREDRFPRGERPPREGRPPRESRPPREAPPLTEIPSPAGSGASGEEDASKSPAAGRGPTAPA